jgi:3-phenylpropionate/cinnamic acid dioxygenase small subunit
MSAGTWESYHAITTLMFRYVECVDAADFDGIAALFADGEITNEGVKGAITGSDAVRALYHNTNRVHADGTLRTRHLTANVIVDIDEAAGTAATRSAFVVFQQTSELPLQPIVAGRYRDTFVREGGKRDGDSWRFERRHIIVDQVGDVREHLSFDLSGFLDQR